MFNAGVAPVCLPCTDAAAAVPTVAMRTGTGARPWRWSCTRIGDWLPLPLPLPLPRRSTTVEVPIGATLMLHTPARLPSGLRLVALGEAGAAGATVADSAVETLWRESAEPSHRHGGSAAGVHDAEGFARPVGVESVRWQPAAAWGAQSELVTVVKSGSYHFVASFAA